MPGLARIHEEYKGRNTRVLAVNVIPEYGDAEFLGWMKKYKGGDHPYATDRTLDVAEAYQIHSLGETVFIDREGRLAARGYPPGLDYEELKRVVEALLQ